MLLGFRHCGFGFGTGVCEQPTRQSARESARARSGRGGSDRTARLCRSVVFRRRANRFARSLGGRRSGNWASAVLRERFARKQDFLFGGRRSRRRTGPLEGAGALVVIATIVAALVTATAMSATIVASVIAARIVA